MRQWTVPLALTTAVVYLALTMSAAACLFVQEKQSRTAHHHTGGSTHSSLCAWACQVNQTGDHVPVAAKSPLWFIVAVVLLGGTTVPSLFSQQSVQSRAPPRS